MISAECQNYKISLIKHLSLLFACLTLNGVQPDFWEFSGFASWVNLTNWQKQSWQIYGNTFELGTREQGGEAISCLIIGVGRKGWTQMTWLAYRADYFKLMENVVSLLEIDHFSRLYQRFWSKITIYVYFIFAEDLWKENGN